MSVLKLTGLEVSIASNTTVSNSAVLRIYCSSAGVLSVSNTTSLYANTTLATGETIILNKATTDYVQGANMRATLIAWPKG